MYKYKFNIVAVDFDHPWNKAVKEVNIYFHTKSEGYVTIKLIQTIETDELINKEKIKKLENVLKEEVGKIFKEKNIEIISLEYDSCEVIIED